jgi:tetratricopeptide (TPR) repeat protein
MLTMRQSPKPETLVASSSGKPQTGPIDVDNGAFWEAEKNLQAIHEMATEHLQQGEYTEALEVFEEILRGQLARYGEDHYRVGTALHNIGIVHMRRGDYGKAIEVYKEAVRVRKKSLDPMHPDVAVSLAQLGVAYMESRKHRKAIGAFREALKIRRKSLGNQHPKVAKILNNIGCSLFELDELEVAKVAFEEALAIHRTLLKNMGENNNKNHEKDDPANHYHHNHPSESLLLSVASTQCNIASIKLYCGKFEEACVDLEEALLIQQCVLGDEHPLARRTQESLAWMERSKEIGGGSSSNNTNDATLDLLSQLTGTLSSTAATIAKGNNNNNKGGEQETSLSVFGSLEQRFRDLYAELDVACRGWESADEEETTKQTFSF